MNKAHKDHELIEPYLLGELDESTRRAFEAQMAVDEALRDEVALQRSLVHLLQDDNALRLRKALDVANRHFTRTKSGPSLRKALPWAAILAMVVAGVGLGWWTFLSVDPHSLFERHFEPYPMIWSQRSGDPALRDLTRAYESGNYDAALTYIQAWERDTATGHAGDFYRAMCLLALGRGGEAAALFEEVAGEDDPLFRDQAQWYLGLSRLQAGDATKARRAFKTIAGAPDHYKKQEAAHILRKLR